MSSPDGQISRMTPTTRSCVRVRCWCGFRVIPPTSLRATTRIKGQPAVEAAGIGRTAPLTRAVGRSQVGGMTRSPPYAGKKGVGGRTARVGPGTAPDTRPPTHSTGSSLITARVPCHPADLAQPYRACQGGTFHPNRNLSAGTAPLIRVVALVEVGGMTRTPDPQRTRRRIALWESSC